jgi:hypothetical protein
MDNFIKPLIIINLRDSLVSAVLIVAILMASFVLIEPVVSRGQASDTFTIEQTITGEISFLTFAQDVTMNGSIAGLTGGTATGSAFVKVRTNDDDGYNMTIRFPFSTTTGMDGETTNAYINNYTPSTPGTPDFNWANNSAGQASEFGYTVKSSSTADVATRFRNNGSVCNNASGGDVATKCWMNPSTTAIQVINRTTGGAAPQGATTTFMFKVYVPSAANPSLQTDTYNATATLTATNN